MPEEQPSPQTSKTIEQLLDGFRTLDRLASETQVKLAEIGRQIAARAGAAEKQPGGDTVTT